MRHTRQVLRAYGSGFVYEPFRLRLRAGGKELKAGHSLEKTTRRPCDSGQESAPALSVAKAIDAPRATRGPKGHVKMRIRSSGSKVRYNQEDTRNHCL